MSRRRKNRRALAHGRRARASDCHARAPRSKGHCELLPAVPGLDPAPGPVDELTLAADLVRLKLLARRGWNT
jgi:hypothetical protein